MIDGLIFGLTDNGVLLICMYMGIGIDQWIQKIIYGEAQGGLLGAVLGATFGNTISDTIGALMDPTMRTAVMGITLGCLIPICFIPIIEWVRNSFED